MSLEAMETKLFWRDLPKFCRDIPEVPEKFEKKKFVFNFRSLGKSQFKKRLGIHLKVPGILLPDIHDQPKLGTERCVPKTFAFAFVRTHRIRANPDKCDLVSFGSGSHTEFGELCVSLAFGEPHNAPKAPVK